MVYKLSKFQNSPSSGDITKEPVWTFDIDYITQNSRSL